MPNTQAHQVHVVLKKLRHQASNKRNRNKKRPRSVTAPCCWRRRGKEASSPPACFSSRFCCSICSHPLCACCFAICGAKALLCCLVCAVIGRVVGGSSSHLQHNHGTPRPAPSLSLEVLLGQPSQKDVRRCRNKAAKAQEQGARHSFPYLASTHPHTQAARRPACLPARVVVPGSGKRTCVGVLSHPAKAKGRRRRRRRQHHPRSSTSHTRPLHTCIHKHRPPLLPNHAYCLHSRGRPRPDLRLPCPRPLRLHHPHPEDPDQHDALPWYVAR